MGGCVDTGLVCLDGFTVDHQMKSEFLFQDNDDFISHLLPFTKFAQSQNSNSSLNYVPHFRLELKKKKEGGLGGYNKSNPVTLRGHWLHEHMMPCSFLQQESGDV